MLLNATTGTPNNRIQVQLANPAVCTVQENFLPQLGFNYLQLMQAAVAGGTASFGGSGQMSFILETEY